MQQDKLHPCECTVKVSTLKKLILLIVKKNIKMDILNDLAHPGTKVVWCFSVIVVRAQRPLKWYTQGGGGDPSHFKFPKKLLLGTAPKYTYVFKG